MKLSKQLLNNFIDITSKSAIACYPFIGKDEKILADKAATDIMREELNKLKEEDLLYGWILKNEKKHRKNNWRET